MTMDNVVTEEPLVDLVTRVWQQIGMDHLSPRQQDQFLAAETTRIEDLIEAMVPDPIDLTSRYRQETGVAPDYLTTVALINTARLQSRESVLERELFAQLPAEETDEMLSESPESVAMQDAQRRAAHRNDPERWRRALHRSEPTEQIVELARTLWGSRTPRFRVAAQYLLQARTEDSQPIPTSRDHALFPSFTSLLEDEMVRRGRADDATAPGRTGPTRPVRS